ncbi:heptose 1-phosphate adenyltransferase [Achromatium sp. WMS2]|nr:heptose 1-phosphate adenyltransferase [Achromatium sp. WMS2]
MLQLPDFSIAKILVVGDLMLDRYWYGTTQRISPEAPVPIVRVEREEHRPGGAANVAVNIATLGTQVRLLGLTGVDEPGQTLKNLLQENGVQCTFTLVSGYPTITKLRIISRHQQLLRMDFENGFTELASEQLLTSYRNWLQWPDIIVLSDYAKGTLHNIRTLIQLATAAGKIVLVDPKQQNFECYSGASIVTPNLAELEAVVGPCPTEAAIVERGMQVLTQNQLKALLVTRGEKGMTLLRTDEQPYHLPTHAREVYDVTGAGDTVISVLAAGLAAKLPLLQATQLANHAAGIVVGKLGTAVVHLCELECAIRGVDTPQRGIVTEQQLLTQVQAAKQRGETIVFTNGCFDILHAGHVTYLEEARRLGNRLIVAINTDASVRNLKGADRPINPLAQRLTMLAALACVDWVVAFSEPTPERLICKLQPDFLVKGGDNKPDQIPGADCVRQAGGRVQILSYLSEYSTTKTINHIRSS